MVRSSARIASKVVPKNEDEEPMQVRESRTPTRKRPSALNRSTGRSSSSIVDEANTSQTSLQCPSSIDEDSMDSLDNDVDLKKSSRKSSRSKSKAISSCISNSALPSPRQPIDELNSARLKLENALAYAARVEEYEAESDDERETNDNGRTSPHKAKHHRASSSKKEKKVANEENTSASKPASLVLKLFDRSVDLSKKQFTKFSHGEIPLYPVCREWMRNGREPIDLSLMEREDEDSSKNLGISYLPQPIAKSKDENGCELDCRIIPSTKKAALSSDDIDNQINSLTEDKYQGNLLTENVNRWRQIRSEWRQAAMQNEARYRHSCNVLKQMYASMSAQPLIEPKVEPMDSY